MKQLFGSSTPCTVCSCSIDTLSLLSDVYSTVELGPKQHELQFSDLCLIGRSLRSRLCIVLDPEHTPACSCDVDHSLTEQVAWSVQDLESSQTRVRAEAAADR